MAQSTLTNSQSNWLGDLIGAGLGVWQSVETTRNQAELERLQAINTNNQGLLAVAQAERTNKIINLGIYTAVAMLFILVLAWFYKLLKK